MSKQILFGSILVLLILSAVVVPVSANAIKTEFSGVAAVAGPPTSLGECTNPDGREHCRGLILVAIDTMSDPRISGIETVLVNYNWRFVPPPVVFTGPMWGTSQIVNDGGYWDVVWTGVRDEQGFGYLRAVAHGKGGYAGLKAFFSGERLSPNILGAFEYSGYILEPGGD